MVDIVNKGPVMAEQLASSAGLTPVGRSWAPKLAARKFGRCMPQQRHVFSSPKDGSMRADIKTRAGLDTIADVLRPSFIPRPVAKALLAFFGASFVWSLVQKVLSDASAACLTVYSICQGGGI